MPTLQQDRNVLGIIWHAEPALFGFTICIFPIRSFPCNSPSQLVYGFVMIFSEIYPHQVPKKNRHLGLFLRRGRKENWDHRASTANKHPKNGCYFKLLPGADT